MIYVWALLMGFQVAWTWRSIHVINGRRRRWRVPPDRVSILKPLRGWEDGLRANLESFFRLQHDNFELHFCISPDDIDHYRLVAMLRDLCSEYRHVAAMVHCHSDEDYGIANPKVRNMYDAYRKSTGDIIVISDAGARVAPNYLNTLLPDFFDPETGVVSHLVSTSGVESFMGELEASTINSFFVRLRIAGFDMNCPTTMGLSMAFRRETLDHLGGIYAFRDYLAEDFIIGEKVRWAGKKVRLVTSPVHQHLGDYKLSRYWSRHLRWTKLRFAHSPFMYAAEPLLYPAVSIWLLILGQDLVHGRDLVPWIVAHFFVYFACDMAIQESMQAMTPFAALAWAVRQVLAPVLWARSLCGNHLKWRGNKVKLRMGGRIERL